MISKKLLTIISCSSSILTVILLVSLFGTKPSLSQYCSNPIAKYVFSFGFTIGSIAFLTDRKTVLLFALLISIVIFDVETYEVIHNILAVAFFAYANYIMYTRVPFTLGYVMLPMWLLLPYNALLFEVAGIIMLISHTFFNLKNDKFNTIRTNSSI